MDLSAKLLNEVTCDALRIRTTLQGELFFSLSSWWIERFFQIPTTDHNVPAATSKASEFAVIKYLEVH